MLLATAAVIPAFTALKLSPILGFLLSGCVLGPNGLSLVSDVHTIEVLAEFGVVFFLFEMGACFYNVKVSISAFWPPSFSYFDC